MLSPYLRIVSQTLAASACLPAVVASASLLLARGPVRSSSVAAAAGLVVAGIAGALGSIVAVRRLEPAVAAVGRRQAIRLDELPRAMLPYAVAGAAALGLFLELAVIRWQASVFEFFAFYKNLGLLSCFLGLGLGYALARRDELPLVLVVPLLGWQFVLLVALRHALAPELWKSLRAMPFQESLNMGFAIARSPLQFVAIGLFLGTVFVLTALAFVPLGQLAGRLMDRAEGLAAYGWNLLGSLVGVGSMLAVSSLWTPPPIWFTVTFAALLAFLTLDRRSLASGTFASLFAVATLAWPVSTDWEQIHSPYQLIERGPGERGLSIIRAAGLYYQAIHDLSATAQAAEPAKARLATYYELPYRIGEPARTAAVVGAGTGNDVAAAVRVGITRVEAIEIDPAIAGVGRAYHPERPYSDERVSLVINDARSFFRTTKERFDRVIYGLIDSHTLLSHASSVRIDSFVYTVEGLRDARERLTENGVLSLAFFVLTPELGRKIYLMMTEAFDGHPPICLQTPWGDGVLFLQAKRGGLTLPAGFLERTGFLDRNATFANPALRADPSTDDWPFFYMPRRIYPISYLLVLGILLLLSVGVVARFSPPRPSYGDSVFFFLGAGFMLVETKAVTELGLAFGNTWSVIGIAIAGVLAMGFLANLAVRRLAIHSVALPFLLLAVSLVVGFLVARAGGFPPTAAGRVATIAVLTAPLLFSGLVFSICLRKSGDVSAAMAQNVLGAMVGGVLEYNSMYFGFAFLYWLALSLYVLAFTSWRWRTHNRAISSAPVKAA